MSKSSNQRLKSLLFGTALIFALSGCIPEFSSPTNYTSSGTPESTSTLRSLNFAQATANTGNSGGVGTTPAPFTIEWQAAQSLDANYVVSICDQSGSSCTTEFTVLCAGRHICGIQLVDGTLVSNFILDRVNETASSAPAIPLPSQNPSSGNGSLTTAIAPGFQGFHLELCNWASSVLPASSTVQIHAKKADGTSGDLIQGTPASLSLSGRCSL